MKKLKWWDHTMHVHARFEWKLADFWVGVFWKRAATSTDIWICLLPCVPLHITISYSAPE